MKNKYNGIITAVPQCGAITVTFDYSVDLVARVKAIPVRKVWNGTDKCWVFDIKNLALVRGALPDFYCREEVYLPKYEAYAN